MCSLALRKYPSCTSLKHLLVKCTNQNAQFSSSQTACSKLNVDFYFDTVSPYTWPAFEVLIRYQKRWDLDINYKPVFLGGLTNAASNPYLASMAECANKASYQFMDLETRTANFFNIPFKMKADSFRLIGMIGSLQQQRFATAVLQSHPQYMEHLVRSFFMRSWSEDKDVHTVDDITAVAKSAGMNEKEIEDCLAAMKTDTVKSLLKDVTEEAAERGAFGAPTTFWHENGENEQMFWGSDRFEMVAQIYGKHWEGPNPSK
eukprot:GFUD01015447.1.p1 GENE.GFUD01015447.1~~GFUD01015447.1.p1  ORF type:complete len:280 (-),score=49.63 GFUD01015447.1:222-1001(-)